MRRKRDFQYAPWILEIFNTFDIFAPSQRFSEPPKDATTRHLPPFATPLIIAATSDDEVPSSPAVARMK
jgi:hypothetical protein